MTMDQAIQIVRNRIESLEEDVEAAEAQYDAPACPYCDREMAVGGTGSGQMTWGCYPPMGSDRDDYDCPFYEDHGYAYSTERTIRDVAPLRRAQLEIESLLRDLERAAE